MYPPVGYTLVLTAGYSKVYRCLLITRVPAGYPISYVIGYPDGYGSPNDGQEKVPLLKLQLASHVICHILCFVDH